MSRNNERRIIYGWILDFLRWDGWRHYLETMDLKLVLETETFLNTWFDANTLMATVPYRQHQAKLMTFLCKLCQGNLVTDHNSNGSDCTILETAYDLLMELKNDIPEILEKVDSFIVEFQLQCHAVLVCCKIGKFKLGYCVFKRLHLNSLLQSNSINAEDKRFLKIIRNICINKNQDHPVLASYNYKSFIQKWLPVFQELFTSTPEPHLVEMYQFMFVPEETYPVPNTPKYENDDNNDNDESPFTPVVRLRTTIVTSSDEEELSPVLGLNFSQHTETDPSTEKYKNDDSSCRTVLKDSGLKCVRKSVQKKKYCSMKSKDKSGSLTKNGSPFDSSKRIKRPSPNLQKLENCRINCVPVEKDKNLPVLLRELISEKLEDMHKARDNQGELNAEVNNKRVGDFENNGSFGPSSRQTENEATKRRRRRRKRVIMTNPFRNLSPGNSDGTAMAEKMLPVEEMSLRVAGNSELSFNESPVKKRKVDMFEEKELSPAY